MNFGEFIGGKAQQPIAKSLVPHESELSEFADRCHDLCIRLLQLFAIGLKVKTHALPVGISHWAMVQVREEDGGESWFTSRHDPSKGPSGTILRLLYVRPHSYSPLLKQPTELDWTSTPRWKHLGLTPSTKQTKSFVPPLILISAPWHFSSSGHRNRGSKFKHPAQSGHQLMSIQLGQKTILFPR